MVHSNVWKFEKIWLRGTLIIIQKPKVWRTDGHEDPYIPSTLVDRGYKNEGTINSTFTDIIQAWEPVHKFIETCIVKILSLFQPRTSMGPALIKCTIWPIFFFILCTLLTLTHTFVCCSSNWLSFPRLCSVRLQNVLRTNTFFIILRLFFITGIYKF